MNTNVSASGDDPLIARFMEEVDASTDRAAVVEQWCAAHPARADDFRIFVAGRARLLAAAPTPTVQTHRLVAGEMLGEFKIVRYMTRGGMGEIYEAEQTTLSKRRVALKVMRRGQVSPDARARFMREQEALAKLHQTNIVPVFAAGERDELQYFAMQYIDGATLGHVVKWLQTRHIGPTGSGQTPSLGKLVDSVAGKPFDPVAPTVSNTDAAEPESSTPDVSAILTDDYLRSVATSLAEVADALGAAHQANVLHRDVKPANLMAERSGKCWVIDFGLAELTGQAPVGQASNLSGKAADPALTATGALLGTLPYMAPEQLDGHPEARSDVWALGVTLYELLTLRRPFNGPSHDDYLKQIHNAAPPSPRSLAKVPADLEAICLKALRKSADERYATSADFASDLRHWLAGEPTMANRPWVGRRVKMWARRQPGWAAAVGIVIATALAVTGLLLDRERNKTVTAEQRASNEQLRADAATQRQTFVEAAAAESERQHRYQDLISDLEREYHSAHSVGWRDRAWLKGASLAQERADPRVRDRLGSILEGVDVRYDPSCNEGSAGAVVFDRTSKRLLMAAGDDRFTKDKHLRTPARVRDLTTGKVTESKQEGLGPVGWRQDIPVQVVLPTKEIPTIRLWDLDADKLVEQFTLPDDVRAALGGKPPTIVVSDWALSADAHTVAALTRHPSGERTLLLWHSGQPDPSVKIVVADGPLAVLGDTLAISPDGLLLALGTEDGRVRIWTIEPKPAPMPDLNLREPPTGLTFGRHRYWRDRLPDAERAGRGWFLAAGGASGTIAVWDLETRDQVMRTSASEYEVFGLAFSADGTMLATSGRNTGKLWDIASGRRLLDVVPPGVIARNWMQAVALAPDGNALATACTPVFDDHPAVDLYHLEHGRGIQELRGLAGVARCVTITPDGRFAAGLTQRWQAGVWERATGELLVAVDIPKAMYADHADIRLTDDGGTLIVASGQEARRWQVPMRGATVREPESWKLHPAVCNRIGITTAGKVLLARAETKTGNQYPSGEVHWRDDPRCVRIYELQAGGKLSEPITHNELDRHVNYIDAAPDGSLFVVSGSARKEPFQPSIVAYGAMALEPIWRDDREPAERQVHARLDSTGKLLESDESTSRWLLNTPFGEQKKQPGRKGERVALDHRYAVLPTEDPGLRLSIPGTPQPFVILGPDARDMTREAAFTSDGRFVAWGTPDGAVHVADLHAVRKLLVSVGLPGW